MNSSSLITALEIFSLKFLIGKAYFASLHQCCCYIRQATKHMYNKSENSYNYKVKLVLGLTEFYLAFLFNI